MRAQPSIPRRVIVSGDGTLGPPCPACSSERSRITDSRPGKGSRKRTRKCSACSVKFATVETVREKASGS